MSTTSPVSPATAVTQHTAAAPQAAFADGVCPQGDAVGQLAYANWREAFIAHAAGWAGRESERILGDFGQPLTPTPTRWAVLLRDGFALSRRLAHTDAVALARQALKAGLR